jgi:hypothetical protein
VIINTLKLTQTTHAKPSQTHTSTCIIIHAIMSITHETILGIQIIPQIVLQSVVVVVVTATAVAYRFVAMMFEQSLAIVRCVGGGQVYVV